MDSVVDGETDIFFDEQTPDSLADAVGRFEREFGRFDPRRIAEHAARFDREHFKRRFAAFVDEQLERHRAAEFQRELRAVV